MSDTNQNLCRDLQGIAAELKWSAVELVRIAERLNQTGNDSDAQALHRIDRDVSEGGNSPARYGERCC